MPTEEELTKAKEEAEEASKVAKEEADAAKAATAKLEEELAKERAKSRNFRRLEELTEAEKDKLTAREKELMHNQEAIDDRTKDIEAKQSLFFKRSALLQAAGGNAEVAKELEAAWDEINGHPADEAAFIAHAAKVHRFVKGSAPRQSAATSFASVSVAPIGEPEKKGYGDTPDGQALAGRLGLQLEAKPKK